MTVDGIEFRPGRRLFPRGARRDTLRLCRGVARSHLCGWRPPATPPGRGFALPHPAGLLVRWVPIPLEPRLTGRKRVFPPAGRREAARGIPFAKHYPRMLGIGPERRVCTNQFLWRPHGYGRTGALQDRRRRFSPNLCDCTQSSRAQGWVCNMCYASRLILQHGEGRCNIASVKVRHTSDSGHSADGA
jgi:hypothetical protein